MAIRQVGKALGFSAEAGRRLAKGVDRWFTEDVADSMTGAVPRRHEAAELQHSSSFAARCRTFRAISPSKRRDAGHGRTLGTLRRSSPRRWRGGASFSSNKDDVEDLGLIKMECSGCARCRWWPSLWN